MAIRSLVETLHRVPLFNDLSQSELAILSERVTVTTLDEGVTVFAEGDPCHDLLIVRDGSVKLFKSAPSGRHQLLAVERAGSSLSEVAVLDENPYPASAQTIEPTTLLRLEGSHFRRLILQNPVVALKVIKVLGHRLRRMASLVEELSFSTVRSRLIVYLIRLAEERGRPVEFGIEVSLEENNEELAARLGTVRELVSRNFGRLHSEGLIRMRRRAVTIPDLDILKAEISQG